MTDDVQSLVTDDFYTDCPYISNKRNSHLFISMFDVEMLQLPTEMPRSPDLPPNSRQLLKMEGTIDIDLFGTFKVHENKANFSLNPNIKYHMWRNLTREDGAAAKREDGAAAKRKAFEVALEGRCKHLLRGCFHIEHRGYDFFYEEAVTLLSKIKKREVQLTDTLQNLNCQFMKYMR
ncbi:hypothetical protein RJT34_18779 [Clitoria ternatea]|uniref:Uncharacterized protein n=1 Tax=Clitoria ternatea TaxID=43366 RepID=A0AAN9PEB5_CLITE